MFRPFANGFALLGAFLFSLFNRISILQYRVDEKTCVSCGKCGAYMQDGRSYYEE